MTTTREAETLKGSLVRDLTPVRVVRVARLLVALLGLAAVFVVVAAYAAGFRDDLSQRVHEPSFIASICMLAVSAAASIVIALRSAIPGCAVGRRGNLVLFVVPLVAAGLVVLFAPWGAQWPGLSAFAQACWHCVGVTAVAAFAPWVAGVAVMSRLAPLGHLRTGLFTGLAVFFLGAITAQLHCPSGDAYHLAVAHYLPVSALAGVAAIVAGRVLRIRLDRDLPQNQRPPRSAD